MSLPAAKLQSHSYLEPRQLKLYLPGEEAQANHSLFGFEKLDRQTRFSGELSKRLCIPEFNQWLESLTADLENHSDALIYRVRNRIYRLDDPLKLYPNGFCLKAFKTPSALRSIHYRSYGSKAARAHRYAAHLFENQVSNAEPLGYFERWQGHQLAESYLLTSFVSGSTDLFSETNRLLAENPDSTTYLNLLQFAANSIRRMHDSGYIHYDLGGQNFLFQRTAADGWDQPTFIDLNRGRLLDNVTLRHRARDLAKLEIPSHYLTIFYHMYFENHDLPREFKRWEKWYRSRISFHNRTRKYRHPIREYRASRTQKVVSTGKPAERDFWLWDEKSGQPAVVFNSKDRHRFRRSADWLNVAWSSLSNARTIRNHYRQLSPTVFSQPVDMRQRFGMAIEVNEDFPEQLKLVSQLPGMPLLVRCYLHKGAAGLNACEAAIKQLRERGHEVSLGLVQSRQAIVKPETWREFTNDTLSRLHDKVRFVEFGHAVNRVKWGHWNLKETLASFDDLAEIRNKYPHLTFLGPAVNDFEYFYYPPLLNKMSSLVDGISCHLYVDRRGQPENFQGKFSLLEKCTLGRAIGANWGDKRFYITETNWPIQGTKEYSPIAGAYTKVNYRESPLHVSLDDYASFMVRFGLISLCSGMSERVWWWRLAARGYGVLDDVGGLQLRPAWSALVHFHNTVGSDRFLQREEHDQVIWYHFERCSLAYSLTPATTTVPDCYRQVTDIGGNPLSAQAGATIQVTGSPVYFLR